MATGFFLARHPSNQTPIARQRAPVTSQNKRLTMVRPYEGIACRKDWSSELVERNHLWIDVVQAGNWRRVRSFEVLQGHVIAKKLAT